MGESFAMHIKNVRAVHYVGGDIKNERYLFCNLRREINWHAFNQTQEKP